MLLQVFSVSLVGVGCYLLLSLNDPSFVLLQARPRLISGQSIREQSANGVERDHWPYEAQYYGQKIVGGLNSSTR